MSKSQAIWNIVILVLLQGCSRNLGDYDSSQYVETIATVVSVGRTEKRPVTVGQIAGFIEIEGKSTVRLADGKVYPIHGSLMRWNCTSHYIPGTVDKFCTVGETACVTVRIKKSGEVLWLLPTECK